MAYKRKFLRRKYRKRKFPRKKGVKRIARIVRKVIRRNMETKYTERAAENQQLFHNGGTIVPGVVTYQQISNLLSTSIDTTSNGRLGDEVMGVGLNIKLWLSQKLDRPNVMYRIIVYAYPYDVGDATGAIDLFDATAGGVFNRMLAPVNKERYTVMYDKIIQPVPGDYSIEAGGTNRERSKYVSLWFPVKRKIQFRVGTQNPTDAKDRWSLAVIPYDAFGTLQTDNIASFAYYNRFYFKDA